MQTLQATNTLKSRFQFWLGLLLLCLLPLSARPAVTTPPAGIIGHVQGHGIWVVTVSTLAGKTLDSQPTDQFSNFKVTLPPGKYVLQPIFYPPVIPGQPTPDYVIAGPTKIVTVLKNRYTYIILPTALPLPQPSALGP